MGKIVLRLDRMMVERKMSLNELAERVGISNVNLSKIKNNKVTAIRFTSLAAICEVLDCEAGDTYAYDAESLKTQKAREDVAKERIFSLLPEEQAQELIELFDEFEAYETPESKFAHAMDNIQPLILNDSNNGGDWREHNVTVEQIYTRQSKTKLGSDRLFEVTDEIIKKNIRKGNLK